MRIAFFFQSDYKPVENVFKGCLFENNQLLDILKMNPFKTKINRSNDSSSCYILSQLESKVKKSRSEFKCCQKRSFI